MLSCMLVPVAWLLQMYARRVRSKDSEQARPLECPVIVIGNISIGGTGKTPVIIALAQALSQCGFNPGIVSRGYGGSAEQYPLLLSDSTPVAESGDEPALIKQATGVPVCVAPDRPAAALLLQSQGCDVILSDDGLQHYRLSRQLEVVVVDAERKFGNGRTLPAGPLREPISRLDQVDCIISNGLMSEHYHKSQFAMTLSPQHWVGLSDGLQHKLDDLTLTSSISAISGIGNPNRFFNTLTDLSIEFERQAFADHYAYKIEDLRRYSGQTLLMTAKDAVKCRKIAAQLDSSQWFYLQVEAELPNEFYSSVVSRLNSMND